MRDLPIVSWRRPVNLAPQTPRFTRVRERRRPVTIRLWIPLTPLLALVSPVVMLASPFARLASRGRRVPTVRAAWALGAVLMSLSGTAVSVETPRATIRILIL
ncbi:MAG TPA: hypothetical protein VKQ54_17995 [Caulobacteraceae bacterium]|nr:hypothetical protein [Caulobacteraceae bacterium]